MFIFNNGQKKNKKKKIWNGDYDDVDHPFDDGTDDELEKDEDQMDMGIEYQEDLEEWSRRTIDEARLRESLVKIMKQILVVLHT